jgi:hypothetical protein
LYLLGAGHAQPAAQSALLLVANAALAFNPAVSDNDDDTAMLAALMNQRA